MRHEWLPRGVSDDSSGERSGWALYGVVVTVSWVREADESSIGWLMV